MIRCFLDRGLRELSVNHFREYLEFYDVKYYTSIFIYRSHTNVTAQNEKKHGKF